MSQPAFHQRLQMAMEERGATVSQLVELCGAFSVRSVSRWRNGRAVPGAEALPILARALRVPIDWLCGEGPDVVPDDPTPARS